MEKRVNVEIACIYGDYTSTYEMSENAAKAIEWFIKKYYIGDEYSIEINPKISIEKLDF